MTWRTASLAVWAAFAVLFVAAALSAKLTRRDLPTLDAFFRRISRGPLIRSGLLLVWMWFGWHTFAR